MIAFWAELPNFRLVPEMPSQPPFPEHMMWHPLDESQCPLFQLWPISWALNEVR